MENSKIAARFVMGGFFIILGLGIVKAGSTSILHGVDGLLKKIPDVVSETKK
jgi:hypothetical protein